MPSLSRAHSEPIPSLFRAYSELMPSLSRAYSEPIPSLFRAYSEPVPGALVTKQIGNRDLIPSLFRIYSELVSKIFRPCCETHFRQRFVEFFPDNWLRKERKACNNTSIWHRGTFSIKTRKYSRRSTRASEDETYGQTCNNYKQEGGSRGTVPRNNRARSTDPDR